MDGVSSRVVTVHPDDYCQLKTISLWMLKCWNTQAWKLRNWVLSFHIYLFILILYTSNEYDLEQENIKGKIEINLGRCIVLPKQPEIVPYIIVVREFTFNKCSKS